MKKLSIYLLLSMCLLLAYTVQASAVSIPWFMYEVNQLSDNSSEYLLNKVDDTYRTDIDDTILDVGDRLRGTFKVDSLEAKTGPNTGDTRDISKSDLEYSGVFDIIVTNKSQHPVGYKDVGSQTFYLYDYVFGPYSGFATELGGSDYDGAMAAMYIDNEDNYKRWGTTDDTSGTGARDVEEEKLVDLAQDDDLYWAFGFTGTDGSGDPAPQGGEGWEATFAPEDVAIFQYYDTTVGLGNAGFALNLIKNILGPELGLVTQSVALYYGDGTDVNLYGSGDLHGISSEGNVLPPYDLTNEFNVKIKPVPEPATMLLLGTGLIGLAGWGRKKKFFKKG